MPLVKYPLFESSSLIANFKQLDFLFFDLKASLIQSLRNYGENQMISEHLDLIVDIHERYGPSVDDPCPLDLDILTWTNDLDPTSILSAQLLEMSAICIHSAVEKGCVR